MVEPNAVEGRLEELDLLHHLRAACRMQPDAGEVGVAQGVGLAQDAARHCQDPDVVEHAGVTQGRSLGVAQTETCGDEVTQGRNALAVPTGTDVLGLNGCDKGAQRPIVRVVLLAVLHKGPPGDEEGGQHEQRAEGPDPCGHPEDGEQEADQTVADVGRAG